MEKSWLLTLAVNFLLLHAMTAKAAYALGGSVGIGHVYGGGSNGGSSGALADNPMPSQSSSSSSNLDAAYKALQAWKSAITDDPSGILSSWVGPDVCSYKGVFCSDPQDGMATFSGIAVVGIDLNRANLKGILVSEISLLSDMKFLHLNSNRFSQTVPETFGDLRSLKELDLSNNLFSGPFPEVTLDIPNLTYLDLRFNSFSGPIPGDLFNQRLDAIFLNNNQFDGQLPQNLGNSPASVINLANNKFSGSIPASFGYMGSNLKEILFLNNQLTGCIPEGVGLFTQMQVLDVSSNSLMGHLPDSLSCLSDIEVLNLAHNKLSGVLSDLVCSLRSLLNLTVSYNFFSGFGQDCAQFFYRNVGFDFSANCIPGEELQRPPPECSVVPGAGLSCLRVPSVPRTVACGSSINLSSSP